MPVVMLAGRCVGRDEAFDEFFDGGVGGIIGREFGEVVGGLERDHMCGPPLMGNKKPAEVACNPLMPG
ncbi:MAG: hypothetical protein EP297_00235 [Gammaproteobacteria bacterium]|nr:MAG: hypothetical protein EP297_00235 [Gammaproteobacteria bacterium]